MNHSIDALKSSHEEEISTLVAENQHLQAMLNDVKSQVGGSTLAITTSNKQHRFHLCLHVKMDCQCKINILFYII